MKVTDEEEEGTDNFCRMKGSCDARNVQKEPRVERMVRQGEEWLIRNIQGGQGR